MDADLTGRDAHGRRLIEGRVEEVDLALAVLRRATARPVITGGDWANIEAAETVTRRGAVLAALRIQDPCFIQCRLDLGDRG